MYESLVAEYLGFQIPTFIPRKSLLKQLPKPKQRNMITTLIGVRRCGKTFHLFQTMSELLRAGIPRNRLFYFPFDDDRLGELDGLTASKVLDAYYALVPDAIEGCYLFFDEIQDMPNWDGIRSTCIRAIQRDYGSYWIIVQTPFIRHSNQATRTSTHS